MRPFRDPFLEDDFTPKSPAPAAKTGVVRLFRGWLLDEELPAPKRRTSGARGMCRLFRCWLFDDEISGKKIRRIHRTQPTGGSGGGGPVFVNSWPIRRSYPIVQPKQLKPPIRVEALAAIAAMEADDVFSG